MFAKQARCLSKNAFNLLVIATRHIEQHASHTVAADNEFTPVTIDVPWGKLEGKLWGSPDKQPILAVHGWENNIGVFDDIAPFLTKNSSILAFDLPGHGWSSWLPRGIPYSNTLYAMTMRKIVDTFGWNKVKLLGHSFGCLLCYKYVALFPEEVEFVVSIDALALLPETVDEHCKKQAKDMVHFVELEKKITNDRPRYSEEVAIDKWIKGTPFKSLDVSTAKKLMIRGNRKNEDGTYSFTRDPRVKLTGFDSCHDLEFIKEMAKRITCPYMLIKAADSAEVDGFTYCNEAEEILKKTSRDYRVVTVEGSHHVLMNEPGMVASHIVPFLEKYDV